MRCSSNIIKIFQESSLFPFQSTVDRKHTFLKALRTESGRYKRYLGSPLRYAGGKSWAVGYIIEHLPDNLSRVVSPFFGGGSVEIAIAKEVGIPVIGYDIFDILVCYWQFQIQSPQLLYSELKELSPDPVTYQRIKEKLKRHWIGEEKLPPLKLAAYYYYNHNLSYGPGFLGWMSSVYADQNVYKRLLERVLRFDVRNIEVQCASFEEVLPKHRRDFLYCDPPYYLGEDSTLFRGLYPQRNFPIHHHGFPHEKLRDLLLEHEGGFILSYNDSPTIRQWYRDFQIIELPIHYTMGQGETRIGINRKARGTTHVKKTQELLILCTHK